MLCGLNISQWFVWPVGELLPIYIWEQLIRPSKAQIMLRRSQNPIGGGCLADKLRGGSRKFKAVLIIMGNLWSLTNNNDKLERQTRTQHDYQESSEVLQTSSFTSSFTADCKGAVTLKEHLGSKVMEETDDWLMFSPYYLPRQLNVF